MIVTPFDDLVKEFNEPAQRFEPLPQGKFYLFFAPMFSYAVIGRPGHDGRIVGKVIHGSSIPCPYCFERLYDEIANLDHDCGRRMVPRLVPVDGIRSVKELLRWGRSLNYSRKEECYGRCRRTER
jgi:hypothetical protein